MIEVWTLNFVGALSMGILIGLILGLFLSKGEIKE